MNLSYSFRTERLQALGGLCEFRIVSLSEGAKKENFYDAEDHVASSEKRTTFMQVTSR